MTEGNSRLARLPAWVPVLVPIVISVVSLVVSIIGLAISLLSPKTHLDLPFFVRVQQGELAGYTRIFVQPSFVTTSSNTRSEVINDLQLVVKPEQGKPVEFVWIDQGEWVSPDPTQIRTFPSRKVYAQAYKVTSDPTPLVVSPGAAVVPVLHFDAPAGSGFKFKEGSYDLTLTANRTFVSDSLEEEMTITLTEGDLEYFKRTNGTEWLMFCDATRTACQRILDERVQSQP